MNYFHICSATLFVCWMANAMTPVGCLSLFPPGLETDVHDVDLAELHRAITTEQYAPDNTPLQFLG